MKRYTLRKDSVFRQERQCRALTRMHDGLVRDYIKFRLLSMMSRFFNSPKRDMESQNKYKELIKRLFSMVTHGNTSSIKEALGLLAMPKIVSIMLSGMGVLGFIAILALLRKLYRAMVPKK